MVPHKRGRHLSQLQVTRPFALRRPATLRARAMAVMLQESSAPAAHRAQRSSGPRSPDLMLYAAVHAVPVGRDLEHPQAERSKETEQLPLLHHPAHQSAQRVADDPQAYCPGGGGTALSCKEHPPSSRTASSPQDSQALP